MTLLRFEDENGNPLGMVNWFSVHGTSMNNTNHFISGDNKGTAAYLFEKKVNGEDSLPGQGPFIALFGQVFFFFFEIGRRKKVELKRKERRIWKKGDSC